MMKKNSRSEETIFDLFINKNFRRRTAMYLGEKKINVLKAFIDGYFYCLDLNEFHSKESDPKFSEFNDWIANYFNWYGSTAGWKNIILKECDGDEQLAVDKFFELYDKFKRGEEEE